MMNKQFLLIFLCLTVSNLAFGQHSSTSELQKPVEDQLKAYNAKDLDAFLSAYSDSIEIYTFPDELLYTGKDQMRKVYASFFDRAGDLHCRIVNRIEYGNYVMDQEEVTTSIPGREKFHGLAIYEIKDEKIIRVWFMKQ
jgi:hypothetical protein